MGTFRWRAAVVLGAGLLVGMGACKDGRLALSIDLRTDFIPGAEFVSVVTEVVPDGSGPEESTRPVSAKDTALVDGMRVADFSGLKPGGFAVRVKVMSTEGKPLVERLARLSVSGDYALTMVVTRSCEGVVCPIPEGNPALTTCNGGQCVQPECLPEKPESCPEPQCKKDADCVPDADCVAAYCRAGTCLFMPNDSKCPAGQSCDVTRGCDGEEVVVPTCQPKGATETGCSDGVDDDCDGEIDCEDSDCAARPCDDRNACTKNDVCKAGTCEGAVDTCDDGNGCTDDSCDAKTGCQHTNNAAPCSDGVFCNGADTCQGGACAVHAGPPCAKVCDEAKGTCLGCAVDLDCGPPVPGAWSACVFADTCVEAGTQTRQVTTPTCAGNACTSVVTTETQACTRPSTDGDTCKTAVNGAWSSCGGFANDCDKTGSRSRTVTTYACAAGVCKGTAAKKTEACSRAVSDGKGCGSGKYCCGGSCVSKSSAKHCSACGISCGGDSCKDTGAGYACTCSSNKQCRDRGFGSDATCYQGVCNCQCTGNGCCSGADCHILSGNNYCSY